MLEEKLIALGMSEREARLYLSGLEFGLAPASSIARGAGEKRVTAYQILEQMVIRWYARKILKDHITYYHMQEPESLSKNFEKKVNDLKSSLPEFLGMMNVVWIKPKMEYYSWLSGVQELMRKIISYGDSMQGKPFKTFLGTSDIDKEFEKWLPEFIQERLQYSTLTRSIMTQQASLYINYMKENHEYVIVDDDIFDMANEIVLYGNNKVALLLYNKEELSAMSISSQSFHDALESIFNLLWKIYSNSK